MYRGARGARHGCRNQSFHGDSQLGSPNTIDLHITTACMKRWPSRPEIAPTRPQLVHRCNTRKRFHTAEAHAPKQHAPQMPKARETDHASERPCALGLCGCARHSWAAPGREMHRSTGSVARNQPKLNRAYRSRPRPAGVERRWTDRIGTAAGIRSVWLCQQKSQIASSPVLLPRLAPIRALFLRRTGQRVCLEGRKIDASGG